MAKSYKSMSTIFEKVKSGAINTVATRKFSGIDYFKKNELIKPYLHSIDQTILDKSLYNMFMNPTSLSTSVNKQIAKLNTQRRKKGVDEIDLGKFKKTMCDIYHDFPREIQRDIFNQYYTDIHKLKYEDRDGTNTNRFRFLDRSNDPVLKVITNESHVKSMVFCKNMMQYYMYMMAKLKFEDEQAFNDMMNDLKNKNNKKSENDSSDQGDSSDQNDDGDENKDRNSQNENKSNPGGGNGKGDDKLDEMMQDSKDLLDGLMNEAKETVNNIEQTMNKEEMEEKWNEMLYSSDVSDRFNPEKIKEIKEKLEKITCNSAGIKSFVKKILDRSVSYFEGKEEYIYDEFLNNPIASELLEFEMLHPKFKNLFIEDLQIKDVKKIGKINVYVDISGSMSSGIAPGINRLDFCKALILRLKEMDILKSVYTFNTKVEQLKNNDADQILFINCSGGTSLTTVINHAVKEDENCIVITDGEDWVNYYSEKIYFVGIGDPTFRASNNILEQYVEKKQMISFDGEKVYNIGMYGVAVK